MEAVREAEQRIKTSGIVEVKELSKLLQGLGSDDAEVALGAIHSLRRSFERLGTPADADVAAFVDQCAKEFFKGLSTVVEDDNEELVEACLAVGAARGDWKAGFVQIVKSALQNGHHCIVGELLERYDDVRLWTLNSVGELLEESDVDVVDEALYVLKCAQSTMEGVVLRGGSKEGKLKKKVKRSFTHCWTQLLRKDLTDEQLSIILQRIPGEVIPRMVSPLHLADFLKETYDKGDNLAILALEGLFVLISQHNLDYRDFYKRLYALLTPTAMFFNESRHRFLELVALFLASGSNLPGGLVAAFIKRLCRRALLAPPAGAMWCLRLSLELVRRHPSVSSLVHRSLDFFSGADNLAATGVQGQDPFDDGEADPAKSGAQESSLWELDALRSHSAPAVSRLAEAFSKDFRVRPPPPPPAGDVKDFATLDFTDIFDAEFRRKAKKSPLAYVTPGAPVTMIVENQVRAGLLWQ